MRSKREMANKTLTNIRAHNVGKQYWNSAPTVQNLYHIPLIYIGIYAISYRLALKYGESLFQAFGPKYAHSGIAMLLHIGFWQGYALIQWLMRKYPGRHSKYFYADSHLLPFWSGMKHSLFHMTVILMPCIWFVRKLSLCWFGERMGPDSGPRGWPTRWNQPTLASVLIDTILLFFSYDALFYFTHWAAHRWPSLYKFHKQHHEFVASPHLGYWMSVIDFVVTQAVAVLLSQMIVDPSSVALWIMTVISSINSVHSHSACDLPFFPSTFEHHYHHTLLKVNYGIGFFDWLLGTQM